MNTTIQLVGALSNDLFRVANLTQRGSEAAAARFFQEAQTRSQELQDHQLPPYLEKVIADVAERESTDLSLSSAERYLMYGVQLQNFAQHALMAEET